MGIFNHFRRKELTGEVSVSRRFNDRVTFSETCLGFGTKIGQFTISPEGKREAYIVDHEGKWAVAVELFSN